MKKNYSRSLLSRVLVTCCVGAAVMAAGGSPVQAVELASGGGTARADVPPLESYRTPVKPIDTIDDVPYRARLALQRAQEESARGDLNAAVEELRGFLSKHPDNDHFILRSQLGNLLVQTGKHEEAMAEYQAAVSLEKRFTQGWLNLGEIAYNLGRYDVAARALQTAYDQSERKQANLLYYCAAAYVMAKDHANAAPLIEQLVDGRFGKPRLDWFRALVAAYAELKDADRGRKSVESLVTIFPDDADAWYLAFQFYAGIEDYEQAAVALKVADYIKPLNRKQTTQLGDVFAAIKVPSLASSCYNKAVNDSSATSRDYEKLASAYLGSYDLDAASRAIADGLKVGSTYRLWSLLGDTRFVRLDYPGAMEAFAECAKLDSTQGRPYLMMGYCALQMENQADATVYLERASEFPDQKLTAEQLLLKIRPEVAVSGPPAPEESAEPAEPTTSSR